MILKSRVKKILIFSLKLFISFLFIFFICVVASIIILSSQPRKIAYINNYLSKKMNTDFSNSTLFLRNGLKYDVQVNSIEIAQNKIEFDNFILKFNIFRFFLGKIEIDNIEINSVTITTDKKQKNNDIEFTIPQMKYFIANNVVINDINIDNIIHVKKANISFKKDHLFLEIDKGDFYLKEHFEEKIDFTDLKSEIFIEKGKMNIEKLDTKLGIMPFSMSLLYNGGETEMSFSFKDIDFQKLNLYWPKSLGEESREWVLEHIKSGMAHNAWTKIIIDNDELKNIYAEVEMNELYLDYSTYFPTITKINGLAVFTENDMNIKITDALVLNSKLKNSSVKMDFTEENSFVDISGELFGKLEDVFLHLDKDDKSIKKNLSNIIEDFDTKTSLKIVVPTDDVSFKTTKIIVNSIINNKPNDVLSQDNINLSFIKNENTNKFSGSVVLPNRISYLNIQKPSNDILTIKYECETTENRINIINLESSGFLKLKGSGSVDNFKLSMIYDNNNYNLFYTDRKVSVVGKRIDFKNMDLLNTIKNNFNKKGDGGMNKEIYLKFDRIALKSGNIDNFELSYTKNLSIKSDLFSLKENNLTFNDFGKLLNILDINNNIENGDGTIIFENGFTKGFAKINKVKYITDKNKIGEKDREIIKDFITDSGVYLENIEGDFMLEKGKLKIEKIIAKNTFLDTSIVGNFLYNLESGDFKLDSLVVPISVINSGFGLSSVPILGKFVFGERDAGFFSFTLKIEKKSNITEIKINESNNLLPSFLKFFLVFTLI